jgi:hypothetical protein
MSAKEYLVSTYIRVSIRLNDFVDDSRQGIERTQPHSELHQQYLSR